MRDWVRVGLLAVGGLIVTGPASAAPLERELAALLATHPGIQAAEKAVQGAGHDVDRANATYYPRVDVTADVGPEIIDSPAERAAEDDAKNSSRTRKDVGLSVTQNLFNGFLTSTQVKMAELGREGASHQRTAQVQQFLFEGVTAYVNVLRQKRLIELALSNEENIKQQLNLEDERVRRGAGMAVDVLQAKARLQFAKERRVAFEGQFEDAVSRYTQVFDHGPDIAAMVDPVPPIDALPDSLEKAVEVAVRENPVLLNADSTVAGAREKKNAVRSEYMPNVDLVGAWNYEEDKNAVVGIRRDYSILLKAQWNLFNGFASSSSTARAAVDHAASQDTRLQAFRKVAEQTRLAWQALLTSRQRVELLENAVNLSSEVLVARRKLQEAGKETTLNVLDAENEVYARQIDFTSASYDERLSVYQVLLGMGRLSPSFLGLDRG